MLGKKFEITLGETYLTKLQKKKKGRDSKSPVSKAKFSKSIIQKTKPSSQKLTGF